MPGRPRSVLILGGTAEAIELADRLVGLGIEVVTSLAGATREPRHPLGAVRAGGFGGAQGLAQYLEAGRFAILLDATHPFAVNISRQAAEAARSVGIPYFSLIRPAWQQGPGDVWIEVDTAQEAVRRIAPRARVLLTIGRKEIAPFLARTDLSGVVRMIEAPALEVPPAWRVLRARPPFSLDQEKSLLAGEATTVLVTKNAGGDQTSAKLHAARILGIPVVMIARPERPAADAEGSVAPLVLKVREALEA